jgi:hypothetical protein
LDEERAFYHTVHREIMAERKREKIKREKCPDTLSVTI